MEASVTFEDAVDVYPGHTVWLSRQHGPMLIVTINKRIRIILQSQVLKGNTVRFDMQAEQACA